MCDIDVISKFRKDKWKKKEQIISLQIASTPQKLQHQKIVNDEIISLREKLACLMSNYKALRTN